jgi:L-seryl-tRNA(Ser) seleniumtransferase
VTVRLSHELPYVRGSILRSTQDDYRKLLKAWRIIRERLAAGDRRVYNLSGLERRLPIDPALIAELDDDLAGALFWEEFKSLALAHMGGNEAEHDAFLANRLTAAIVATHLALVAPGQVVIGFSASRSHASIIRASRLAGAGFVDCRSLAELKSALDAERDVALLAVTRLAVTYDILPLEDMKAAIALARDRGLPVLLDDAGGARVGPAAFGQPRSLELGVDVAATGLDKYGTRGPRLGLLAGRKELVSRIRARAWELGLEARPVLLAAAVSSLRSYRPERVRELVRATKALGEALRRRLGSSVRETPVSVQISAEELLRLAMKRAGVGETSLVPYEATAVVSMLLLQRHGILTVHFAGVPPGTPDLLFKFVSPEELERAGGPDALARAVDEAIDGLAAVVKEPQEASALLFD